MKTTTISCDFHLSPRCLGAIACNAGTHPDRFYVMNLVFAAGGTPQLGRAAPASLKLALDICARCLCHTTGESSDAWFKMRNVLHELDEKLIAEHEADPKGIKALGDDVLAQELFDRLRERDEGAIGGYVVGMRGYTDEEQRAGIAAVLERWFRHAGETDGMPWEDADGDKDGES